MYVRRQWCQHLRAVLEVQKTMARWVHMRQARISGDPSVDRLSASMQVRCPSVCSNSTQLLLGLSQQMKPSSAGIMMHQKHRRTGVLTLHK